MGLEIEYSCFRIRSSDWLSAQGSESPVCIEGRELHEWLTDYHMDFAPRSCLSLFTLHFVLLHTSFETSLNQLNVFFCFFLQEACVVQTLEI